MPNTGQPVDPLNPGNAADRQRGDELGDASFIPRQTVYNSLGQVTESVAADGEVTQYEYNSLGQQTATIGQPVVPASVGLSIPAGDPAGTLVSLRTETTYDAYGNTASQTTNIYEFVLPNGTTQIDSLATPQTNAVPIRPVRQPAGNHLSRRLDDERHLRQQWQPDIVDRPDGPDDRSTSTTTKTISSA